MAPIPDPLVLVIRVQNLTKLLVKMTLTWISILKYGKYIDIFVEKYD